MKIKVFITDDHSLVIKGLQKMFDDDAHIEIRGIFLNGETLLEALKQEQPDVLLLDIQLPDIMGDELMRTIKKLYPEVNVLVLTNFDSIYYIKAMMQHGARGYILKNTDQSSLLSAIATVHSGEQYLEPAIKEQLVQDMLTYKKQAAAVPALTRREIQILDMISTEHTTLQIAEKLFLSTRTVENHRINLQQKLGVKNTAGLIKKAIQLGLISI